MSFEILSRRVLGPFSRYRLDRCRDRFGNIVFLVADADRPDPQTGLPEIIRQGSTEAEVLAGLDLAEADD